MQIVLRPALPVDRRAVEAIVRDAYSPYVPRIGRPPGPMLDDYGDLIGRGLVTVAEIGGAVVGLIVLVPQDSAMLLDNIAVAPSAQGMGIGRLLLDEAERRAQAAGFDRIELYTNEAMTENLALYARIGYAETRRIEEKGFRRVYMEKVLGGDPQLNGPAVDPAE